jgi:Rps23 Pro-64 3,4-dihydroxylase Tpa1-like proline 4-hydroxylase
MIATRAVTFNYFLTKQWDPAWGGQFVWEHPYKSINPEFNTLVMFLVGPDSNHYVSRIEDCGDNLRVALTGWFYTHRQADSYKRSLNLDFV